jgi:membrane-anchored protein YejM (alkaline phosphatase superfamily)
VTSLRGHGVIDGTSATTVAQTAGGYIPSIFDVAHDNGYSTAMFSSDPAAAIFDRSWGPKYGAPDTTWTDNGRDKISLTRIDPVPARLALAARDRLASAPTGLTYVQLSTPDVAGHRYGFASPEYRTAVTRTDAQLRAIWGSIRRSTTLNGHTLLIVTGEHGGYRTDHTIKNAYTVRVPFIVWGPGVPAGVDLYRMNPDLLWPGTTIPAYADWQPVRNAYAANLAMTALQLPALTGSNLNGEQNFNVFAVQ